MPHSHLLFTLVVVGCAAEMTPPEHTDPDVVVPTSLDPGPVEVDVFERDVEVDLLFVVDNSPGMLDDQVRLADIGTRLFERLRATGADFHVGVTTMDLHSGSVVPGGLRPSGSSYRFIEASTPEDEAPIHFRVMTNPG